MFYLTTGGPGDGYVVVAKAFFDLLFLAVVVFPVIMLVTLAVFAALILALLSIIIGDLVGRFISVKKFMRWEEWMLTNDCWDEEALNAIGWKGRNYVYIARSMPYRDVREDFISWRASRPRPREKEFIGHLCEKYGFAKGIVKRRLKEVKLLMEKRYGSDREEQIR